MGSSSGPQPTKVCRDQDPMTSPGERQGRCQPLTVSISSLKPARISLEVAHAHCPMCFHCAPEEPIFHSQTLCCSMSALQVSPGYTNRFLKHLLMCHVLQSPHQLRSALLESLQFVSLSHTGLTPLDTGLVYIAAEAHGWSVFNLMSTRTLRAAPGQSVCSLQCCKGLDFSFVLIEVHAVAFTPFFHLPESSPALQHISCSPTWHHPPALPGCISSLQQTHHTVSVPAAVL